MVELLDKKKLKSSIIEILTSFNFLLGFTIVLTIAIATHKYLLALYNHHMPPEIYMIYKTAYLRLIAFQNIYTGNYDDYLYSPTFPFIIAPFSYLPNYLGALLWDLLNALSLLYAIMLLPFTKNNKFIIFLIVALEALISLQNFQVNALVVALMIFTYLSLENEKPFWAALCVAVGFFIKLYGLGFAILFLFYPKKVKFLFSLGLLMVLFFVLPLFVTRFDINHFIFLYKQWIKILGTTLDTLPNFFGILRSWFGITSHKIYLMVQIITLAITAMPLLRIQQYKNRAFRILYFSLLLIWVIVFSNKAESQTFIVAMVGIAIWFIMQKRTLPLVILFIFIFTFSCLLTTDLCPHKIRVNYYNAYGIQAIPGIIMWIILSLQLMFGKLAEEQKIFSKAND